MTIKIKKQEYNMSEQIFLLIWTFYSFCTFVFGSELGYDYYDIIDPISTVCKYGTILALIVAFCCIAYFNQDWDIAKVVEYVIFLIVIFLVELKITDTILLLYVLFILLAQVIDFDKLLSYDIKLKLVLLCIIIGMCALGIVENRAGDFQSGYKQAYGFSHPNTFACYVLTMLVEWLCLRYKKMKWYDWAGVSAIAVLIVYLSNSRASVYTFAGIFILFILADIIPNVFYSRISVICFAGITPLMAALSFISVELYAQKNSFIIALDKLLSGRIRLAYNAIDAVGIQVLGQEIEFSSRINTLDNQTYFLVDNAYVHIALRWGALILILMVFMYSYLFVKLIRLKRIDLALMGLFFVILGFGETYMYNIFYNLTMLCILGVSSKTISNSSDNSKIKHNISIQGQTQKKGKMKNRRFMLC